MGSSVYPSTALPTVQIIIDGILPVKITIHHPTHVITPLIAWVTVLFGISIRGGTDVY